MRARAPETRSGTTASIPTMTRLGPLLIGCLGLFACTSSPEPAPSNASKDRAARELPADWRELGAWDFERLVADLDVRPWSPAALETLSGALESAEIDSVRAAVLLAWGADPAHTRLIEHLELRQPQPTRHGDAAEVVAAAALGRRSDAELALRLEALAIGPEPHPDLEVRVECAASALDLDRPAVLPFLIKVLHAGTPAELEDPIDWPPQDTLAWSKSRAAEALGRRAGLSCDFRPDGSFQHQMETAARLAKAVGLEP